MLSLPAPEDTRIQQRQQMQRCAFFCGKIDMDKGYMRGGNLTIVLGERVPVAIGSEMALN